jgi:type IV pilus assembly protein PilP
MKNTVKKYIWPCSVFLLSVMLLFISCNEKKQQVPTPKTPAIVRNKIVFAGQSQPTPLAHAEPSKVSLTVNKKTTKAQQYAKTLSASSTAEKPLTKSSLASSEPEKKLTETKVSPSKQQTNVQTAEASADPMTSETDMAMVLKKLAPKPFQYRPQGRVDPFIPLIVKKKRSVAKTQPDRKVITKKRTRILTLLEKFDLSQLKLTAIMATPQKSIAIVEETTGRGFVVKIGTRIGINSGRVVDILMDRIIIQEAEEIIAGKKLYITKEMKLNKPDSEF